MNDSGGCHDVLDEMSKTAKTRRIRRNLVKIREVINEWDDLE